MTRILGLFCLIFPQLTFAAGYTWLSDVAHGLHTTEHFLTFALIASVIAVIGFYYRAKISKIGTEAAVIPDDGVSIRNMVESIGEGVYGLASSIMGEEQAKRYFPAVATLFIFIFFSNSIGLIPGFLPPTSNINTTLALGLFVFIYYNYHGVKTQGIVGHIKHFMGPVWYLAPLIFIIELISHSVRPLSLALRLRGNMEGDHLVLAIFSDLVPLIVPMVFLCIGLFVCFMQAFVFTLLTMVYIALATEQHDHADH